LLDVQNLCISIDNKPFLTELSFQVAAGESLILLGKNGVGKTLLLNILSTLVEPTSGTVSISGVDAFSNLKVVRPQIGYIPVGFEGYPELSVVDYLDFFADAYKLDKQNRSASINTVLELMDIQHLRDIKMGVLSTGERQRILFAKTFLHEPQLWLLDEPLAPLDPRGQIEMAELFSELKSMGKTIVIATNRLEDVQQLCDNSSTAMQNTYLLGILNEGTFVVFNSYTKLQQEHAEDMSDDIHSHWLIELYLEVTRS